MAKNKNKLKIGAMSGYHERIRLAMNERSISQLRLSKLVGLSQPEIHYYTKGTAFPRPIVAQKIAKVLRCSFLWLNWGYGDPAYYEGIYRIEEFWLSTQDRLAYISWSSNLDLKGFQKLFPYTVSPQWFEPYNKINRVPSSEQSQVICDKLGFPKYFASDSWDLSSITIEFYVKEYKRHFDLDLSPSQAQERISLFKLLPETQITKTKKAGSNVVA